MCPSYQLSYQSLFGYQGTRVMYETGRLRRANFLGINTCRVISGQNWAAVYRSGPVLAGFKHVMTCLQEGCIWYCSNQALCSLIFGGRVQVYMYVLIKYLKIFYITLFNIFHTRHLVNPNLCTQDYILHMHTHSNSVWNISYWFRTYSTYQ